MNFFSTMSYRSMVRYGWRFQGLIRPHPDDGNSLRVTEAIARQTFGIPPNLAIVFSELTGWLGTLTRYLRLSFLLVWIR